MPCIFCIAVGMAVAGAAAAIKADGLRDSLAEVAKNLREVVDSESVAKFEATVEADGRDVPVAVTLFKPAQRVRIQILTHDLNHAEAEKLQNLLADRLDLRIIERSSPEEEALVREAFADRPSSSPDRTPDRPRLRLPWGRR